MTQNELGAAAGVSGVAIMRYERDLRTPKQKTLEKIAAALGVDSYDLLYSKEEMQRYLDRFAEIAKSAEDINAQAASATAEALQVIGEQIQDMVRKNNLLPDEFNEFEQYIEKLGYRVTLIDQQYYLVHNEKQVKISVGILKQLVRSSSAMLTGLLGNIIDGEQDEP